jgi:hypothetical protein
MVGKQRRLDLRHYHKHISQTVYHAKERAARTIKLTLVRERFSICRT